MPGFFELPYYRQHAIACGLDMAHAHACDKGQWHDVIGCTLAHDVIDPVTLCVVFTAGSIITEEMLSHTANLGCDYLTVCA